MTIINTPLLPYNELSLVMVSVFEIFLNVKMAVFIENNHSLVVVFLEEYPNLLTTLILLILANALLYYALHVRLFPIPKR